MPLRHLFLVFNKAVTDYCFDMVDRRYILFLRFYRLGICAVIDLRIVPILDFTGTLIGGCVITDKCIPVKACIAVDIAVLFILFAVPRCACDPEVLTGQAKRRKHGLFIAIPDRGLSAP